jgi:hypothetical protein
MVPKQRRSLVVRVRSDPVADPRFDYKNLVGQWAVGGPGVVHFRPHSDHTRTPDMYHPRTTVDPRDCPPCSGGWREREREREREGERDRGAREKLHKDE